MLLAAISASVNVGQAAVTLTLTDPNPTATPGAVVSFLATAFNNDPDLVNLNAIGLNVQSPLVWDDSAFLNNWFSIAGNSFLDANPQVLFAVTVPVGTGPGTYLGSVDLLGGPDTADQNILGSASFSVTVDATSSAIPEPASASLVCAGLGLALLLRGRARR